MPTLDNLFGPHINNVASALGRASQRHALLANNLANVNTPGYKRQDLDFSITLQSEMDRPFKLAKREGGQTSAGVRVDGSTVDLEKEVLAIAETELRYQALSDMAASYFSGLKNVIREGR